MTIDPQHVTDVYSECLAEGLAPESEHYIEIEGIVHRTAFDKRKLQAHADDVAEMLSWVQPQFRPVGAVEGGGGGWSFLNICEDKEGTLWTGLHWTCEQLIQLGIGLGMAEWLGPRELWEAFPQGMPYVLVKLPGDKERASA